MTKIHRLLPFLALVLAGCAVGPDYEMPEYPVPDAWQAEVEAEYAAETPPILDWWSVLGDPVLDSLMIRAREANLDLRIAVGRVSEARALRTVAGGDFWPQVQADGSFSRQDSPLLLDGPDNQWNGSVGALWELDLFGRVRRGREAADAGYHAAIEDFRDVQVSLYAEVATSYVTVRALQARIDYAEDNAESQRETMEIVTAREEAGLVPQLDVARARSNLANTEAAIPSLRAALAAESNRLSLLLGQPPGEEGLRIGEYAPIEASTDSVVMVLPVDLIRRRPDIRAAERRLAAQTARVGVATAELYPKFSLGGIFGVLSGSWDDLFTEDALQWAVTPGFSWNLFNGGKLRGQIGAEEARVAQALASYEKAILAALAEVESSMVALRQQNLRRALLKVAVEAAQESVTLVRTQYIEGLTDFQAYLDAQRVLFDQQDALAKSRGDVFSAFAALNRALGGGWSLEEPIPDLESLEDPDTAAEEADTAADAPAQGEDR
jgi:NodT family efflux transporter outer membrane factor (OMF) lipoprotein